MNPDERILSKGSDFKQPKKSVFESSDNSDENYQSLSAAQDITNRIDDIGVKQSQAEYRLNILNEDMRAARNDIHGDRFQTIQILAFFVAFFTFVSVEFQLFANLKNFWQVISLTLILAGVLIAFTTLLARLLEIGQQISHKRRIKIEKNLKHLGVASASLILIGLSLVIGEAVISKVFINPATSLYQDNRNSACRILTDTIMQDNDKVKYRKAINDYQLLKCE